MRGLSRPRWGTRGRRRRAPGGHDRLRQESGHAGGKAECTVPGLPSVERGARLGNERARRKQRCLRELPRPTCGQGSRASHGHPGGGLHDLSSRGGQRHVEAFASPGTRRQDGVHLLSLAPWLDGAGAVGQEHHHRNLHDLPRGVSGTLSMGTSTGRRGLQQLSRSTWLRAAGAVENAAAIFVPDLSRSGGASVHSQYPAGFTGRQPQRILGGRWLCQLSLPGSRFEPSLRPSLDALGNTT